MWAFAAFGFGAVFSVDVSCSAGLWVRSGYVCVVATKLLLLLRVAFASVWCHCVSRAEVIVLACVLWPAVFFTCDGWFRCDVVDFAGW